MVESYVCSGGIIVVTILWTVDPDIPGSISPEWVSFMRLDWQGSRRSPEPSSLRGIVIQYQSMQLNIVKL